MVEVIASSKKEIWDEVEQLLVALGLPSVASVRDLRQDCGCCFKMPNDDYAHWASLDAIKSNLWLLGVEWLLDNKKEDHDAPNG